MFSRFDLSYLESDLGALFGTHRVSTAFASGGAALAIAGNRNAEEIVTAIVKPVDITLSNTPENAKVRRALTKYIRATDPQRDVYLALAQTAGIKLDTSIPPDLRAMVAIADPVNADKNLQIADQLDLI